MSALRRSQQQTFSGLNLLQLVRRLVPNEDYPQKRLLAELGKHVRFRGHIGYEHPKHEIAYIDARSQPVEVYLNQHVLAGLLGPLPAPYLEMCHQRLRDGDSAMATFFDIFNHRLNALRYWMLSRSMPDATRSHHKLSLPGQLLNTINGDSAGPLSPRQLLGLAGLLHDTQRSHTVVQLLLRRLLNLDVTLEAFHGGWLPLDENQQMHMGRLNSRLGADAVIGRLCWDQHKCLGLVVNMPDFETLVRYLPDRGGRPGDRYTWFSRISRWLTHYRYDLDVTLRLPKIYGALKLHGSGDGSPRLGYTSWLREKGETHYRNTGPTTTRYQTRTDCWQARFTIPAQEPSR